MRIGVVYYRHNIFQIQNNSDLNRYFIQRSMVNSPQANSPSKLAANTLRILLVDDQKFVQYKLQEMLSIDANLEIVGTAGDGEKAIALVESLKPDVILIDIEMPKMNGIEATKIISQRSPDCKILIFSSYEHQEYVQKIIAAGADGYVLKSTPAEDLITAIHSVHKGYSHFGSQLIKKIQLAENVDRASGDRLTSTTSAGSITADRSGIDELKARQTDEISLVNRWLVWGGISVLTMIILAIPATAILKYKTVVRARAIVRPAEELHQVRAAVEGQVGEILVEEGQEVERGQAIATVDVTRSKIEQNQLNKSIEQQKLQLERLNAQIASLANQIIIAKTKSNSSEIAAAKSELESIRRNYRDPNYGSTAEVEKFQKDFKAIEANLNATKAKYNRYKSIAEAGAITAVQLSEAQSAVSQQEQELEAARSQLERATATANPTTADLSVFQERIEQAEHKSRATIAGLNREREALIARRIEINKQLGQDIEELNRVNRELAKSQIIATATGTIFDLDLLDGRQTVRLGEEIARIIPENSKIQMKATVLPEDITKFEVGQKVKMQVSACPDPNYGTLGGTVAQITPGTKEVPSQQGDSFLVETSNTSYEVIIAPDNNTFSTEDRCSLQLGSSQIDIISREETLLQYILRKARLTT